jgi:hypothetical protein
MNKRIRQLAEQSKFTWVENDKVITGVVNLEKFAELIVAECVQTLIDHTPVLFTNEVAEEDWDKGYDRAMKDCVHYIQEHFGVE